MAILCFTLFFITLTYKMFHHGHTTHPERCAKPSLPNLYAMASWHPSLVRCPLHHMPSIILGPGLYAIYYIKLPENIF